VSVKVGRKNTLPDAADSVTKIMEEHHKKKATQD